MAQQSDRTPSQGSTQEAPVYDTLCRACVSGDHATVERLLDTGIDAGVWTGRPLRAACQYGHIEVLRVFVRRGLSAACHAEPVRAALCAACANGHLDVVKLLFELGLSRCTAQENDNLALREAIKGRHPNVVKYLTDEIGMTLAAPTRQRGAFSPLTARTVQTIASYQDPRMMMMMLLKSFGTGSIDESLQSEAEERAPAESIPAGRSPPAP